MIPFAIRQTQRGLDMDHADSVGRNAIEELQVKGVFRASTIRDHATTDTILDLIGFPAALNPAQIEITTLGSRPVVASYSLKSLGRKRGTPGLVHLDPIGVSRPNGSVNSLELIAAGSSPLIIPSVTLRNGDRTGRVPGVNSRFSLAESRSAFQTHDDLWGGKHNDVISGGRGDDEINAGSQDDLVFGIQRQKNDGGLVQTKEIAPPQQYYEMLDNQRLKRQSEGKFSWSVFLNPSKHVGVIKNSESDPPTPVSRFKAYVLTHNRRSFLEEQKFYSTISNAEGRYGFGDTSGSYPLRQLKLKTSIPEKLTMGKGSWVMLINLLPEPDYAAFSNPQLPLSCIVDGKRHMAEEAGYDKQIMFARVQRVDRQKNSVSIDGGPFEIFPDAIRRSETFMVFLPEVMNVYERTIRVEY